MLDSKGKEYLKSFKPIGCRDKETLEILKRNNIEAYFSGCLTLTIGKMGGLITNKKTDEIIFCDSYYNISIKSILGIDGWNFSIWNLIITVIKERRFFRRIFYDFGYKHKMFNLKENRIKKICKYIQLAHFFNSYKTLFSKDLLRNAVYTTQWIEINNKSDKELLIDAEQLVRRYSKAKFIVTSRIHCALPSIGCETPVLFVTSEELESKDKTSVGGRLKGLSDFFNCISYSKNHKLVLCRNLKIKQTDNYIGSDFIFENKDIYKEYRDNLINICKKYVKENQVVNEN